MIKVLHFASYIAIPSQKQFSRNLSGYGIMVHDIVTALAKEPKISISILTQSGISQGLNYNGVKVIRREWADIFLNFKFNVLIQAFITIIKERVSIKKWPNIILYFISMGYCKKIVDEGNYDLIHIHGISYYTIPLIEMCDKFNIKYIITLHGLNSFHPEAEKKIGWDEKKYIRLFYKKNIDVSVISTGIRKKILSYLSIKDSENFKVITNGFSQSKNKKSLDIRKKYSITNDCKIMLCVGGISSGKNQIQALRAFELIQKNIDEKLYILFLGYDSTNGEFERKITKKNTIYCGFVPKNEISSYYEQSDLNLLISKYEGFGLSTIEGFSYGLPLLTYSDLEVIDDIYCKNSVILMKDRADATLARGIEKVFLKKWNKINILNHSKKFNLELMKKKYINFYKEALI